MRKHLGVLCATLILAACGTPGMLAKTDENVSRAGKDAQSAMQENSATPIRAVERVEGAWIAKRSIAMEATESLPDLFKRHVRFSTGAALPMSVVLGQISRSNGLVIRMNADVTCGDTGGGGQPRRVGGNGGPKTLFAVNCTDTGEPAVPLHYNGSLSGLLDAIAHRSGTHWTYRDGVVQYSRYVTRTFQIKMMPGKSTYTASVGKTASMKAERGASGGSGGSSGGGVDLNFNADAKVSTQSELDYWGDLVKTVTDMLSPAGRVTPSTMTSSLVVTDTAEVVARVGRYIDSENAVLGRQVKLRVQVYSVGLTEKSAAGINWNVVYKTASGFAAGLGGPALSGALAARSGGLSFGALPNGRFAGSNAFLKALSQQGRVSTVIDTTVVTLNNQPAPVAVTQNQGFIAQTKMTAGTIAAAPVVTAEQAMLTTGFVMNLLPTLMDNRSVMLQVQIDMSDLKSLEKINLSTGAQAPSGVDADDGDGDGISAQVDGKGKPTAKLNIGGKKKGGGFDGGLGNGTYMQLPNTASVQTMQRASLKSGETLVLSGFRRKDNNTDRDGIFAYEGGTKSATQGMQEVVILISPELTEGV